MIISAVLTCLVHNCETSRGLLIFSFVITFVLWSILFDPPSAPPFITNNTQYFVYGQRNHFLNQCTNYICKRYNQRNSSHYKKFCLLQSRWPQPQFVVIRRQAEQARINYPNLFWNELFSTFIIDLTSTRRQLLEHFLTETSEDQCHSTPQKCNKQVLFRNGLSTSHTIAFLSQILFSHISINSLMIYIVSMAPESPWKDLSIDTSHVSKQSIMAKILGRSTDNYHGTVY